MAATALTVDASGTTTGATSHGVCAGDVRLSVLVGPAVDDIATAVDGESGAVGAHGVVAATDVQEHAFVHARVSTSDMLAEQIDVVVDTDLDTDSDMGDEKEGGLHGQGVGHGDSFVLDGEAALSLAVMQTPDRLCGVCDDTLTVDNVVALPCMHVFCRECVESHCSAMIDERSATIRCLDGDCRDFTFTRQDVKRFVTERDFRVYMRLLQVRMVGASRRLCYCPRPSCAAVCALSPTRSASQPSRIPCSACSHSFCFMCHEPWPVGTKHKCATFNRKQFVKLAQAQGYRQCPGCNVWIERTAGGCAQMRCVSCDLVFCWFCGESLEHDYFALHWSSGACKGKLGHTWCEVLRYRLATLCLFFLAGLAALLCFAPVVLAMLLFGLPCLVLQRCCGSRHTPQQVDMLAMDRAHQRRVEHFHARTSPGPSAHGRVAVAVGPNAVAALASERARVASISERSRADRTVPVELVTS